MQVNSPPLVRYLKLVIFMPAYAALMSAHCHIINKLHDTSAWEYGTDTVASMILSPDIRTAYLMDFTSNCWEETPHYIHLLPSYMNEIVNTGRRIDLESIKTCFLILCI